MSSLFQFLLVICMLLISGGGRMVEESYLAASGGFFPWTEIPQLYNDLIEPKDSPCNLPQDPLSEPILWKNDDSNNNRQNLLESQLSLTKIRRDTLQITSTSNPDHFWTGSARREEDTTGTMYELNVFMLPSVLTTPIPLKERKRKRSNRFKKFITIDMAPKSRYPCGLEYAQSPQRPIVIDFSQPPKFGSDKVKEDVNYVEEEEEYDSPNTSYVDSSDDSVISAPKSAPGILNENDDSNEYDNEESSILPTYSVDQGNPEDQLYSKIFNSDLVVNACLKVTKQNSKNKNKNYFKTQQFRTKLSDLLQWDPATLSVSDKKCKQPKNTNFLMKIVV